jgi:hypothetical protein
MIYRERARLGPESSMSRLSILATAATAAALAIGAVLVWPARDYLLAPPNASERAASAAGVAHREVRTETESQNNSTGIEDDTPAAPAAPMLVDAEASESSDKSPPAADPEDQARQELLTALEQWVVATNSHDIDKQMDFYPSTMEAFYLRRDISREAVRAEKRRIFEQAKLIDVRVEAPYIALHDDRREATMRFRKQYDIEGRQGTRRGEVLQELRWVKQDDGWKIISERDLEVLR